MRRRVLGALIGAELRRLRKPILQGALFAAVAIVVIAISGSLSWTWVGGILLWWWWSTLFALISFVLRDQMDGSIEFLQSLPIDRGDLALARLAPVALLSIPTGLSATFTACVAWAHFFPSISPLRLAFGAALSLTTITFLWAGLWLALSLRMANKYVGHMLLLFMAGLVGVAKLVNVYQEPLRRAVETALTAPWFPPVLSTLVLVLVTLTAWLAFHLTKTGYERFKPQRDQMN